MNQNQTRTKNGAKTATTSTTTNLDYHYNQDNSGGREIGGSSGCCGGDLGVDDNKDMDLYQPVSPSRHPLHVPAGHPLSRLRRLSKEEPYVHSVAQTSFGDYAGRLRNRRQSDPGRISVSPIRMRGREEVDSGGEGDQSPSPGTIGMGICHHPRLNALRSISMTVPEEMGEEEDDDDDGLNPSSRPSRDRARRRCLRSNSLPAADPAMLEIGEAIGAVAMSQPPSIAELPPLVENITLSPSMMSARRRRSISMESTSLEAIDEDNNEVLARKPHPTLPPTTSSASAAAATTHRPHPTALNT